ncbi:Transcriptional regulator [Sterolibacterium denitrificans]|uniref:Transcriptional regulator n=1 Tax=Sterolibacterium denitrificans TaxID=157592 RepID=A0A7Z7HQF4_9PROT|nr:MerR family DNA-binding protein [Sterolibacterium denitrificans]SMB25024.1 Transcriptional regulator [Sterolibacterium denitrificans]
MAKRCGLAPSRIRFYESQGLLQAVSRQTNGYREYPEEALLSLQIIVSAQNAGFTLDEIRSLVPADLTSWKHDELIVGLERKIAQIEALEARLAQNRANLQALIEDVRNKPENMDCAENAKRLMKRAR